MPKIIVTDSLADTLKLLRTQNGIKSKDLAAHIGKTPGYVSKLEKQEVKNIDLETIESIFSFILGVNYKKTEIWEQIYASLQIKYSKEEMEDEVWFANFDTVYRYIPIPESIVDYINEKMLNLNISREYLLSRINANESLTKEEISDSKIEENIWYLNKQKNTSIKINMSLKMLSDILDKETSSSPYVFVFCILYYLLKIEKYDSEVRISEPQTRQLNHKVKSILNSHKFYSIIERQHIVSGAKSQEELQDLLSSFDNDNALLIKKIISNLKLASDMDIRITNERLSSFLENIERDMWFVLKIISLNYRQLESVDLLQKKEFINDLENLIRKYASEQMNIKNTETY